MLWMPSKQPWTWLRRDECTAPLKMLSWEYFRVVFPVRDESGVGFATASIADRSRPAYSCTLFTCGSRQPTTCCSSFTSLSLTPTCFCKRSAWVARADLSTLFGVIIFVIIIDSLKRLEHASVLYGKKTRQQESKFEERELGPKYSTNVV